MTGRNVVYDLHVLLSSVGVTRWHERQTIVQFLPVLADVEGDISTGVIQLNCNRKRELLTTKLEAM